MDEVKKQIEKIVKKVSTDKEFKKEFKKDPVKAIEKVTGIDLPDNTINSIIEGVKAKITADTAKSMMDKAMDFFNSEKK